MPRLLSSLAVVGLVTPAVIGLPVVTTPTAKPHPVAPSVARLALSPMAVAPTTPIGPGLGRRVHGVPARSTKSFTMLGVTWRHDPRVGDVSASVRWRKGSTWSAWEALWGDRDDVPDAGSNDVTPGLRAGTSPLWVGKADGVEVRATTASGVQPQDLRVDLIDPGTSSADARPVPRDVASAAQERPAILTRAEWGADESLRRGSPSYSKTVKAGFIHHTATANGYSQAEVPAMLRSVYAYHVKSNGWSDIGYNYLVDRFGRIWEGRAGGTDKAVVGAHTGGFNADTFGASLLGTYSTVAPSAETLQSLEQLFAWKLGSYYRDPTGKATLRSAGGGTSKYPAGTYHDFDVVSLHRDAGNTACPGAATYARLGEIRTAISNYVGAAFLDPVASATRTYVGTTTPVTIKAGTRRNPVWTLDVLSAAGTVVRTFPPSATPTVDIAWDLTDSAGAPVPAGRYTLRLTGTSPAGEVARPFESPLTVRFQSIPKGSWMRPGRFISGGERPSPSPSPSR